MKTKNLTKAVPLLILVLALGACGTQTTLDTSYAVPQAAHQTYNKLAVIALFKNATDGREFESAAVAKLDKAGVAAVPGFSFLGGKPGKLSKEEMEQKVQATGANGVLMFKMIAVDTTDTYVPPTPYVVSAPDAPWWSDRYWGYYTPYPYDYWGYWYPAYQVIYSPGYWEMEDTYRVETTLYRTSDGKLVWSGISSTYNPRGDYDLAKSLLPVVIGRLEKIGLLIAA